MKNRNLVESNTVNHRRKILKVGWTAPLIAAVTLPVHAQTSEVGSVAEAGLGNQSPSVCPILGEVEVVKINYGEFTKSSTVRWAVNSIDIPLVVSANQSATTAQIAGELSNLDPNGYRWAVGLNSTGDSVITANVAVADASQYGDIYHGPCGGLCPTSARPFKEIAICGVISL